MSSQPVDHQHPVVDFAGRLDCRLDSLAETPLMSMTPEQKREALVLLSRGAARLDALRLRLLAEAEQSEATVESGARSAADWLATETRQVRREARSDLKLALELDDHGVLSTGMAAGRVNTDQARAIVASVERLPSNTTAIDPDLPTPVRQGIAFTQLIESVCADDLPKTGGCGATVVVTMTLEQLLADRLTRTAGIIPMVLGTKGQVLDVGRKRRYQTTRLANGRIRLHRRE